MAIWSQRISTRGSSCDQLIVYNQSARNKMACNFSQLKRRQSSNSLLGKKKSVTEEDIKDQFYRQVTDCDRFVSLSSCFAYRGSEAGQKVLESLREEENEFRSWNRSDKIPRQTMRWVKFKNIFIFIFFISDNPCRNWTKKTSQGCFFSNREGFFAFPNLQF